MRTMPATTTMSLFQKLMFEKSVCVWGVLSHAPPPPPHYFCCFMLGKRKKRKSSDKREVYQTFCCLSLLLCFFGFIVRACVVFRVFSHYLLVNMSFPKGKKKSFFRRVFCSVVVHFGSVAVLLLLLNMVPLDHVSITYCLNCMYVTLTFGSFCLLFGGWRGRKQGGPHHHHPNHHVEAHRLRNLCCPIRHCRARLTWHGGPQHPQVRPF